MFALQLRRFAYSPYGTFGQLFITGAPFDLKNVDNRICWTLEPPWLNNRQNVSCIPLGGYKLEATHYYRGDYPTYEVTKVPNRTHIKMHCGRTLNDTKGCPLLGNKLGWHRHSWALTDSDTAYQVFMEHMAKYSPKTLNIINDFGGRIYESTK